MRTLKACQKDGRDFHILRMSMWKFPVKTTLKEAPDCQWSKFPAFENVGIKQKKQYNNCEDTTQNRKELY